MDAKESTNNLWWWSSAAIRLVHPLLQPDEISAFLATTPSYSRNPGETKIHFEDCTSAGYWYVEHRVNHPGRPDAHFVWMEEYAASHYQQLSVLIEKRYRIDVYVGIHQNILDLGFILPPTPTLWKLGIAVGMEIFASRVST